MYQSIAPFDSEAILQDEWLNSRAAIARFDRHAIEIRIIDNQESPLIDLAFIEAIVEVLKYLVANPHSNALATSELKLIYDATIEAGSHTHIANQDYFHALGIPSATSYTAKEIWRALSVKLVFI